MAIKVVGADEKPSNLPVLDDALKLVRKDPVLGFIALAIAATKPPAETLVVRTKGRTITLPNWTGTEWAWYGQLAFSLASTLDAKNPVGQRDKDRQQANLLARHAPMQVLGDVRPTPKLAFGYYDAAVRLVIASSAAASGPTRGELAAQAFGRALVEAPETIGRALAGVLKDANDLYLKLLPREAAKMLNKIFGSVAQGFGLPNLSLGTVVVIGAGLWMFLNRRKGR